MNKAKFLSVSAISAIGFMLAGATAYAASSPDTKVCFKNQCSTYRVVNPSYDPVMGGKSITATVITKTGKQKGGISVNVLCKGPHGGLINSNSDESMLAIEPGKKPDIMYLEDAIFYGAFKTTCKMMGEKT